MTYSKILTNKFARIALVVLGCSLCAAGQVLRGTVTNGTNKKPAAGDDVILIKIDKVMNEEARTKSNARGEFSFQLPDSQTMRAVRVIHQKISYYQPVVPGSTSVAVNVYDVQETVAGIHRLDQTTVFQAQGGTLQVIELFNVRNESQPPRTQPDFSFYLPDGATEASGQAMREGAMPLKSAPVPQEEKGKYLFTYPLIPGMTHFEVAYKLPYPGQFKYEPKFGGPVDRFYVVTPNSIAFSPESASGYQATSDEPIGSGFKNFGVRVSTSTAQPAQLAFNISGEGMLQEDASAQQAAGNGGAAGQAENEGPGGGMGIPNERPNPLSQGQWAFLGVLTLFLAGGVGVVFVTSRPGGAAVAASPQNQSGPLLDALKEEMFQLEADRIHGKLSQPEYQTAKSVLDKTLQRAMKKK